MIRQNLVGDFRGVAFQPIDFVIAGLTRRLAIPGLVSFEIEGVASRNRSGDPYYIDNTGHPANRRLALARSKETHVHAFGLDLDLSGQGNNGHFAPFSWAGLTRLVATTRNRPMPLQGSVRGHRHDNAKNRRNPVRYSR